MAGTIGIQDSYNNVKIACDRSCEPGMNNGERQAVNESLQNIANAINENIAMKAKIELLERQVAETDKHEEVADEEVVG